MAQRSQYNRKGPATRQPSKVEQQATGQPSPDTETKEDPDKVTNPLPPIETKTTTAPPAKPITRTPGRPSLENRADTVPVSESEHDFGFRDGNGQPMPQVTDDYYYNVFRQRVIRVGRRITIRGQQFVRGTVCLDDVVQEYRIPGSAKIGLLQLYTAGQPIPDADLQRVRLIA